MRLQPSVLEWGTGPRRHGTATTRLAKEMRERETAGTR
jgi:hypothetical protein